jgi:hypothetical protein
MIALALAALLFLLFVASLFRLAMGLRETKRRRETARAREEALGRHVVAEIPLEDGIVFFVEDQEGFSWGGLHVARADLAGSRLSLNGAVMASWSRPETTLPPRPEGEAYEGRECWDVILYKRDGSALEVACGTLREGVSREIASRIFEAARPR